MSEAVAKIEKVQWASFAEEVWNTLQLIDVSEYVETKLKFDYLPWANAWVRVMEVYPESDFEFDEPKFYPNGTGEQWVTVNIRRGEDVVTRRWWLPYLNHTNHPIADPNSQNINNTRMRVLVKCLAMCGLGTELYSGEDVPDENNNKEVKGTSVRKNALEGVVIDEVAVEGYVAAINAMLKPELATISENGNVMKIHYELIEDWEPITTLSLKISTMGDLAIAVADGLSSWRRSIMREAIKRYREESRKADEEAQ